MRVCSRYSLVFFLITIVLLATFLPVGIVQAHVQSATIQWLVDEPNYKKAKVHVLTHNASYTLLMTANITVVGSETIINMTAQFNPEGPSTWAMFAIPDTFYDAPWNPGQPVQMFHIHFPGWFRAALTAVIIAVLIFALFFFLDALLVSVMSGLATLLKLLNLAYYLSIPYVYFTIHDRDKNDDNSLDLFFPDPRDPANQPINDIAPDYLIATPMSWWYISYHSWSFLFISVEWYEASWHSERVTRPAIVSPPFSSFEWAPITPVVGQDVVFVSTSFDPDGSLISSHWTFGDGFGAYGRDVRYIYAAAGWYAVSLEVTDDDGLTDTISTNILVASRILNITADSPVNILVQTPDGSLVGYDSGTGDILLEIDGSTYTGPWSEPQNIVIPNPHSGIYTIRVVGTGTGEYTLTVQVVGPSEAIIDTEIWSHTTCLGEIDLVAFQLNPDGTITNPTFSVIPEVPLGTIVASAAMIIALVAYVAMPRWRRKQK